MRIWGYILIVLNIGAAAAFTYFATKVWGSRLEWQYALLKQQIVNLGLPLEPMANAPDNLDEGTVPFYFYYADHQVVALSKDRLKKLIPPGGDILGSKDPNPVTNQQDELIRVEKKVFEDLEGIKDKNEQRFRVMLLLLNLSKGSQREGVYALLRDWPDPKSSVAKETDPQTILAELEREDIIRRDAASLGRTAQQASTLLALAAVANANAALSMGGKLSQEEIAKIIRKSQKDIARWIRGEISIAAPDAWVKVNPPPPFTNDPPPKNDNRARLTDALQPLLDQLEKKTDENKADPPDPEIVKAALDRVKGLLEGDNPLTTTEAKTVIPFILAVGGNLLGTQEDIYAAKAKLVELLVLRKSTDAETNAMKKLADLMIPPQSKNEIVEKADAEREDAFLKNRDGVAFDLLHAYFDEAKAPPLAGDPQTPSEDYDSPRRAMAGKLPRSPAEKRQLIAHVLYHLDAHLGGDAVPRANWYRLIGQGETNGEEFKLPATDQTLLDNRVKWHQRVAAVVGLEAYAAAVEAQATQLQNLRGTLRDRIIADHKIFQNRYNLIVAEIRSLANQFQIRQDEVAAQQLVQKKWEQDLVKQLVEQKEQEDKLSKVTLEAKTALTGLEGKVDELFDITKKLGAAQDALLGLELKLRELELGKKKTKK